MSGSVLSLTLLWTEVFLFSCKQDPWPFYTVFQLKIVIYKHKEQADGAILYQTMAESLKTFLHLLYLSFKTDTLQGAFTHQVMSLSHSYTQVGTDTGCKKQCGGFFCSVGFFLFFFFEGEGGRKCNLSW